MVSEFWRANCSRAHRSIFMTSPQQEGGAQHSVHVGSWHTSSIRGAAQFGQLSGADPTAGSRRVEATRPKLRTSLKRFARTSLCAWE